MPVPHVIVAPMAPAGEHSVGDPMWHASRPGIVSGSDPWVRGSTLPWLFYDRDDIRFQGRDERLEVRSFCEGQTFLSELVKRLASSPKT